MFDHIRTKIEDLARTVFGIQMSEHFQRLANRSLFGLWINLDHRRFDPMFGSPPAEILHLPFSDSIAGYCVDVRNTSPNLHVNADVFLLSRKFYDTSPSIDCDAIILHELVHFVKDSNLLEAMTLNVSAKDKYHGIRLHSQTDIDTEKRTRHTKEFCIILAAACRQLASQDPRYRDRIHVQHLAMIADVNGRLRG